MEPPPSQAMSASDDLKDKGVNEWCRFLAPLPRVLLNSHPLPCFSSRLFLTVCPSAMRFQLFVLLRLLLQHPRLPVLFLVIDAAASPPAQQNFWRKEDVWIWLISLGYLEDVLESFEIFLGPWIGDDICKFSLSIIIHRIFGSSPELLFF
jgi:hypothetical protein